MAVVEAAISPKQMKAGRAHLPYMIPGAECRLNPWRGARYSP